MSSLRDAQLRQEFRAEIMRGYQAALCNGGMPDTGWTLGDEVGKVADNLLAALAAHPVEPAGVSDEAVEAACQRLYLNRAESGEQSKTIGRRDMRAALAAALPHLQPQPVAPRPLLAERDGYNALAPWLEEVFSTGTEEGITWEQAAEQLFTLGAVREMPTREQIAEVLWKYRQKSFPQALDWDDVHSASRTVMLERADAVLALLGWCVMTRLFALVVAVTLGIIGSVLSATSAHAAPYESWQFRNGTICVQTGGSTYWPITQAVTAWNKTDVQVVADKTCAGYPRNRTIIFKAYYDANDRACAKTGSNSYSWEYVTYNGVRVARWVPNLMVVWLNWDAKWAGQCRATLPMRLHLISHEVGHALGFSHNGDVSVMNGWKYQVPTWLDVKRANERY